MVKKEKEKAAEKKEKKSNAGRPSLYRPEYEERVYKLCLLGATDKEMADIFGVTESTFNLWKIEHQEFSESIKKGKEFADANVASRLYQRAMGYEHPETITASFQGEITDTLEVTKCYPPDPTAAIFWLKNRQKEKWRDKQEVESLNVNINDDVSGMTDEELAAELAKMGFEKK